MYTPAEQNRGDVRDPQVQIVINNLDANIEELHHILEQLNNRLSPILRNVPAMPKDGNKESPEPLVPLAARLEKIRSAVTGAMACIASLLERMEL